jgi:hypothetical protein
VAISMCQFLVYEMKAESSVQEKWKVLLPMTHLLPCASFLLIYLMIDNENEMSVIQDGNACREVSQRYRYANEP